MKIGTITFLVIDVTLDKEEVVGMRWVMVGSWRSSCDVGPPRGLLQDEDEQKQASREGLYCEQEVHEVKEEQ